MAFNPQTPYGTTPGQLQFAQNSSTMTGPGTSTMTSLMNNLLPILLVGAMGKKLFEGGAKTSAKGAEAAAKPADAVADGSQVPSQSIDGKPAFDSAGNPTTTGMDAGSNGGVAADGSSAFDSPAMSQFGEAGGGTGGAGAGGAASGADAAAFDSPAMSQFAEAGGGSYGAGAAPAIETAYGAPTLAGTAGTVAADGTPLVAGATEAASTAAAEAAAEAAATTAAEEAAGGAAAKGGSEIAGETAAAAARRGGLIHHRATGGGTISGPQSGATQPGLLGSPGAVGSISGPTSGIAGSQINGTEPGITNQKLGTSVSTGPGKWVSNGKLGGNYGAAAQYGAQGALLGFELGGPYGAAAGAVIGGLYGGLSKTGGQVQPKPVPSALKGVLANSNIRQGQVKGPGDGRSDSIMTRLSQGEWVVPADVVGALGKGSTDAGSERLGQWALQVRHGNTKRLGALAPPVK